MASFLGLTGPVKGKEEPTKYFVTASPNIPALFALLQLVQFPDQKRGVLTLTWFYTLLGVKAN